MEPAAIYVFRRNHPSEHPGETPVGRLSEASGSVGGMLEKRRRGEEEKRGDGMGAREGAERVKGGGGLHGLDKAVSYVV